LALTAEGDAVIQVEGGADGDGKLAHPRLVRICQPGRRQPPAFRVDFDHGKIGLDIDTADFSVALAQVLEPHFDLFGAFNDVAVGQNVAIFANQDAGTLAIPLRFRSRILVPV
jgi:hypothetical protein